MNRELMQAFVLAVFTSGLGACGGSRNDSVRADTEQTLVEQPDSNTETAPEAASTTAKKKALCAPTGLWALCSVEKRLTQSGFVVRKNDSTPPKRNGFSIQPVVYTLGHSRLEVFLYPSPAAVAREVAKLDTVRIAPPGGTNSWEGMPSFVRSANLLAVFMTDNPQSAERVSLALTAGAPQPPTIPKLKPMVTTPESSH